jgi:hypothetical protein
MNKKKLFLSFFICSINLLISQNTNQTLIELGILNDTPLKSIIGDKYNRKIYKNASQIYAVKNKTSHIEIIEYHSDKSFANFYFIENKILHKVSDYQYRDENLNEISKEQQEQLKEQYTIYKDSTKIIAGMECFKVVLGDEKNDSASISMFVSDSIPNLPDHFPLASNVLNAEPLEIDLSVITNNLRVGILNLEDNKSIEVDYNILFSKALDITYEEFLKK